MEESGGMRVRCLMNCGDEEESERVSEVCWVFVVATKKSRQVSAYRRR